MKRLKELRTAAGLTQKQMAAVLNIDRTTYVKYESGASEPTFNTLIRLAEHFNVTTDFILGKPPFDQWELVMEHRDEIIEAIASELNIFGSDFTDRLRSASFSQFVAFIGACISQITFDPESHSFSLVFRLDQ